MSNICFVLDLWPWNLKKIVNPPPWLQILKSILTPTPLQVKWIHKVEFLVVYLQKYCQISDKTSLIYSLRLLRPSDMAFCPLLVFYVHYMTLNMANIYLLLKISLKIASTTLDCIYVKAEHDLRFHKLQEMYPQTLYHCETVVIKYPFLFCSVCKQILPRSL